MSELTGMEWREVKPGDWWLVFSDAPEDLGRNGPVGYPPSMRIACAGLEAGSGACCHVYSYYNGAWPDDEEPEGNFDYMHVCDPRDLIAELQAWMETSGYSRTD